MGPRAAGALDDPRVEGLTEFLFGRLGYLGWESLPEERKDCYLRQARGILDDLALYVALSSRSFVA